MPLDFPSSPSVGDVYTYNGRSWQWNGTAWTLVATSSINNTPIGNIFANTGAFTSITATEYITANGNITGDWFNANQVISLGNVTANYIIGNGACISGLAVSVSNINNGTSNITATAANGNIAVSVAGNSNVVVFADSGVTLKGNLVPSADNVYSLGSNTARWANLWMSGNTIMLGNVTLKDVGNNVMGVYGSDGTTPGAFLNASGWFPNPANITANSTLTSAYNNLSAGPITINSNVTVTVSSGAVWTIV